MYVDKDRTFHRRTTFRGYPGPRAQAEPDPMDMARLMRLIRRVGEALEDLAEMGARSTAILVNPYTLEYMIGTGLVSGQQMLYDLPVDPSVTVQPGRFRIRASMEIDAEKEAA